MVVATGVMQKPLVPSFAPELDPSITQLHSSDYRNPSQLQEGPVLVVGASHSGADIAYEAAAEHETILSGRTQARSLRRSRPGAGAPASASCSSLAHTCSTVDTPLGRKMRPHVRHGGAPLLRYRKKDLRAAGVERVLARTVGVQDGLPVLDDGRVLDVRNVIWCTGFRPTTPGSRSARAVDEDGFPSSTAAPSTPRRASTSWGCSSCTRSRRCSSWARAKMPSASQSTSLRDPPRDALRRPRGSRRNVRREAGRLVRVLRKEAAEVPATRPAQARSLSGTAW